MMQLYNANCLEKLKEIDFSKNKICIVTDPPFNIGYHYNTYKDKLDNDLYYEQLKTIFSYGCPYVVIHYPEQLHIISFITNCMPTRIVSWCYNSNTSKQHRDIGFYKICPDFKKVLQPYKNLNDKRIKERIANGKLGAKLYDWWNINQVKNTSKEKTEHPCQMPLEVMKNIIGILPSDYIILDPFMGSGTTGVACKELNRNFIGIEIDEQYFNIAKKRIGGINENN